MARYGAMYGPDVTFLGVPGCDVDDPASYRDADVVIIGAPFDGNYDAISQRADRAPDGAQFRHLCRPNVHAPALEEPALERYN